MNLPQTLPSSIAPPRVLPPADRLFARRAERLRKLSAGHPMARWMEWLASVSDCQQKMFERAPELQAEPLTAWRAMYDELCAALDRPAGNEDAALQARVDHCLAFAAGREAGEGRDQTDVMVAAALQVAWARASRQRCAQALPAITHREQCPCCGSAAIGGVVMAGDGRGGLRYLECSLCATRWHVVRAHCSLCDSTGEVAYLGLEGTAGEVQAETCAACTGYIKLFFEARAPGIDPVADDLATLVLDVLVGEEGFARGAPNLLLVAGEAV